MKGANRHIKIYQLFFKEKFQLGQFDLFRPFLVFDWAWVEILSQATVTIGSLNSQDMIYFMVAAGSLNTQDMISQVNILCDVYCMDIM